MTIRPTPSGPGPRGQATGRNEALRGTRANPPRSDAPQPGDTRAQAAPGDAVRISDAARALQLRADTAPVPAGEVAADRLAGIARRIADGHYDRPEVIDAVVRRIAEEF
jgi:hypothetical protein